MTQGLDLLRAAAHEGDAIDLGQIGGGHRVAGGGPAGLAVVVPPSETARNCSILYQVGCIFEQHKARIGRFAA